MYRVLVFVHVLAAATWLGANLAQFALSARLRGTPGSTRAAYLLGTVRMGTVLYTPAAILLLTTGILMVIDNAGIGFGSTFVSIGFAMIVVGAVLGAVVFGKDGRRAAQLLEAGNDADARPVEQKLARFGAIDTVLLLLTIASMVWQFGLRS